MIAEHFNRYFKIVLADDSNRHIVHKLRYDVYCTELGFEDASAFPDQEERDRYDQYADHLLIIHRSSGAFVGTVRLVIPPADSQRLLPLEENCGLSLNSSLVNQSLVNERRICEVSRLAVHARFRMRRGEANQAFVYQGIRCELSEGEIEHFPYISVGLYIAAAAWFSIRGLDYAFVMMEPRLARHLSRVGLHFVQMGETIDYHGLRAPFFSTPNLSIKYLKGEIKSLYELIENELKANYSHKLPNSPFEKL